MNQNPTDFFSAMEKISRENDKALRSLFGKYIKGNFLIEMKHFIMDNLPEIYNYYDMQMSMEKVVAGNELMDFDICRMIVGCHSSNIIFLSDDERVALEKSSDYKRKLALNVEKNIKLRRYGSAYFRRQSIMQGDMYLAHNVPYNVFVMSLRMNEILHFNKKENPYLLLYYSLSNKALATLSLLEDNFLDNCYPICRAIIELYLKLLLFKDYPNLVEEHNKFNAFEVRQSCCEQEYPEEFNEIYRERINKNRTKKVDYLHYGWVDKIPEYHNIINNQPYSINGILSFLRATHVEEEWNLFDSLEVFYKMCHGYTHGNVGFARFPLLHYFEVSIILHLAISHTYTMLCEDLEVDRKINDIDILEKAEEEFTVLNEQYQKKSTKLFERHHKKTY